MHMHIFDEHASILLDDFGCALDMVVQAISQIRAAKTDNCSLTVQGSSKYDFANDLKKPIGAKG
ncbi:MAG: hypothetical protein BGP09_35725 [Rhizobium sp. 60-20]|nr:MAG: hypothetical protein BGP09_35725 [Rhizobium sp. 60-20]